MGDLNSNPLMTNSVQPEFLFYITHNPSEAPEAQKLQLHAPSAKVLAGFFFFCYYYFFKSSSQLLGQPHIALPYQFPLTLLSASEWLMLVRQLTLCESMFSQEAKEVFPHVHGIMSLFISKPSGFLPYPDTKLKSVSVLTSTLIWLSITTTEILYLPTAHTCSPSSGVFVFCFPSLQATLPAIKFSLSRVYY